MFLTFWSSPSSLSDESLSHFYTDNPIVQWWFISTGSLTDLSPHACPSNTSHVLGWFPVRFSKQRLKFSHVAWFCLVKWWRNCYFWLGVDYHFWICESSSSNISHVCDLNPMWFSKHWLKFAKGGLDPPCKELSFSEILSLRSSLSPILTPTREWRPL